jgi:hypothetical protein
VVGDTETSDILLPFQVLTDEMKIMVGEQQDGTLRQDLCLTAKSHLKRSSESQISNFGRRNIDACNGL